MAKKRKIILSTTAALAALLAGLLILREPRHDGRSLSEWAEIGLHATDQEPWNTADVLTASNAIRQIGAKSFPWIRRSVLKSDSAKVRFLSWLESASDTAQEFQLIITKPLILRTERSCFVLYSLSDLALPLVDELSASNAMFSESYIESIGPNALPALIPMITNQPPDTRTDLVVRMVKLWGTNALSAGPSLWGGMKMNRDRFSEGRWLTALAGTGHRPNELSEALVELIHSDAKPPYFGQPFISALRTVPGAAAPALVKLLDHPQNEVRRRALLSLFGETVGQSHRAPQPYFRMQVSSGPLGGPGTTASLNPSSSNALHEAAVSIRLNALRLAMQSHAGRFSNGWNLPPAATEAFMSGFTNDPDRQVSREAVKALEEFRLIERP